MYSTRSFSVSAHRILTLELPTTGFAAGGRRLAVAARRSVVPALFASAAVLSFAGVVGAAAVVAAEEAQPVAVRVAPPAEKIPLDAEGDPWFTFDGRRAWPPPGIAFAIVPSGSVGSGHFVLDPS
jgi:hypothetical protein